MSDRRKVRVVLRVIYQREDVCGGEELVTHHHVTKMPQLRKPMRQA